MTATQTTRFRKVPGGDQLARVCCRVVLFALSGWLLLGVAPVEAQEDRLYERDPYDLITLDAANNNEVLKVEPLPMRVLPENPAPIDKLTVRLVDKPEETYELQWRSIEKIELFEQLVLNRANELVAEGKRDEAYDYFTFLEKGPNKPPGLSAGMEGLLYAEAVALHQAGQFSGALGMLQEIHRRNPQRANLGRDLGRATVKVCDQYVAKGDYRSARKMLSRLTAWYPNHPDVATQQAKLAAEAKIDLDNAVVAKQNRQFVEASQMCVRAAGVWPELPGLKSLAEQIHREYPRVVVGVSSAATELRPNRLADWASRRSGRLIHRTLMELTDPTTEDKKYACPVGKPTFYPAERRFTLTITPGIGWSTGGADLTVHDVSRRLLAMADPADPAYRPDWGELLGSMTVRSVVDAETDRNMLELETIFRRRHVRPDALLQTVLTPCTALDFTRRQAASNGPYMLDRSQDDQSVYQANPNYFAVGQQQPKEIVERYYAKGATAIRALRFGDVQLLDRVNPWGMQALEADENIDVRPYAMPLLHCLIPNQQRPLVSRRTIRRALVYGIHRQMILDQLTGGSAEDDSDRVVSGPFLPGYSPGDVIGYACDPKIKPRKYDPYLAIALARVGVEEWIAAEKKKDREPPGAPPIVLAHPPHEIARVACASIQRQLKLIGVVVELRELSGGVPDRIPNDVDLLYAELAVWEPVVDARRLLDSNGMSAGCSSYMSLALRQLEQTTQWRDVQPLLHRIHRIAYNDVAIIPLWQLRDYFACHKSLMAVGTRPVALYQNVEAWQPSLRYVTDQ